MAILGRIPADRSSAEGDLSIVSVYLCIYNIQCIYLYAGLIDAQLPQFSYYTPDIDNDGHNTNVTFAGEWLNTFLTPLLEMPHFIDDTMIVITWDEDDYSANNHIQTILLGPTVKSGFSSATRYEMLPNAVEC